MKKHLYLHLSVYIIFPDGTHYQKDSEIINGDTENYNMLLICSSHSEVCFEFPLSCVCFCFWALTSVEVNK